MRKITLFLLLISLVACDNDDLTDVNNDGTGGISCLVNGELLRPKGNIFGNRTAKFSTHADGSTILMIGLTNNEERFDGLAHLFISIYDVDLDNLEGQTFQLKEENTPDSFAHLRLGEYDNVFATNAVTTGELKITHYDYDDWVISGTFSFTGVNANGETLEITDGRFDLNLQ